MSLAGSEVGTQTGHAHPPHAVSPGGYARALRPGPALATGEAFPAAAPAKAGLRPLWKPLFDFVLAALLLTAALPVILLLAALIWCLDRHSPFYGQPRVGRHGVMFRVWKLRSMYIDADTRLTEHLQNNPAAEAEWRRCFKLSKDPRILPLIGGFIRRSSLDELPQFWNILKGEMSLVGPRPFPPYHLACFSDDFQRLRSTVRPGLTGLWQIQTRSNGDLSDQERWDSHYIRHQGFWLDLSIITRTIPAVLSARGAR